MAEKNDAPTQAVRGLIVRIRGKRLRILRGELQERPFAHLLETGSMRRTHLRGHPNILKRLLIHSSAFNLGLMMRILFGVGKPRRLQGAVSLLLAALSRRLSAIHAMPRSMTARIRVWLDLRHATYALSRLRAAF